MKPMRAMAALLLLVVCLAGSGAPVAAAPPGSFADWDAAHWAAEPLGRLIVRDIIRGDGGRIWPERHVTKLEALVMLSRLYDWADQPVPSRAQLREDVPAWGVPAAAGAIDRYILPEPPPGGAYNFMRDLTRLDAAVIIVRTAGLAAANITVGDIPFTDVDAIPADFLNDVALAVQTGLLHGYPDGTFRPEQPVTRAEWAALLTRLEEFQPPPEPAQPPGSPDDARPPRYVRGVVALSESDTVPTLYMEVMGLRDEKGLTFAPAAHVYRDGRVAAPADIRSGDTVWLWLNEVGRIVWASATPSAYDVITGTVLALDAPAQTITLARSGREETYPVSPNALIDSRSGLEIPFASIQPGFTVELRLSGGTALHVRQLSARHRALTLTGTITDHDIAAQSFTVQGEDGDYRLLYTGATVIVRGGEPANPEALAVGTAVEVMALPADGAMPVLRIALINWE